MLINSVFIYGCVDAIKLIRFVFDISIALLILTLIKYLIKMLLLQVLDFNGKSDIHVSASESLHLLV